MSRLRVTIAERLRAVLGTALAAHLGAFYGAHLLRYLISFIILARLARILGPSAWGGVALALAFSAYLSAVVEFGFDLSATRIIAQSGSKRNANRDRDTLIEVLSAKLLLLAPAVILGLAVRSVLPILRNNPQLFWIALAMALVEGLSAMWYLLGRERMRLAAILESAAMAITLALVLLLVQGPADDWQVLVAYGVGRLLLLFVSVGIAFSEFGPLRLNFASGIAGIVRSSPMFAYRAASALYTTANVLLVGALVAPAHVGMFAGAERICRAAQGLLEPATRVIYSHLSRLRHGSEESADQLHAYVVAVFGAWGIMMTALLVVFAEPLVAIILGPEFLPSVPLLRILAIIPAATALTNAFGVQGLLAEGRDREFLAIVVIGGLTNIALGGILTTYFGTTGMAISIASVEVAVGLWLATSRQGSKRDNRLNPQA